MRHLLLLLLAFPMLGQAQDWPLRKSLGVYVSAPGQELPAFLAQLGHVMNQHTRDTGFESCGVIAVRDDVYAVQLYTDQVQRGCTMRWSEIPEGFTSLRQTIHTHPIASTIVFSENDREWSRLHKVSIPGPTMTVRRGFTKQDMSSGPAWLVENNALYFYDGKTPISRRVSPLSSTPAQKYIP